MTSLKYLTLFFTTTYITSGYAAETYESEWGVRISTVGLYGMKSTSSNGALFIGANYAQTKIDSGTGFSEFTDHRYGVEVGYRLYLKKTDTYRYIDTSFSYSYLKDDSPNNGNNKKIDLMYGLEKYISSDFSVEGSAGIGVQAYNSGSYSFDNLSLPIVKLAINYYF